MFKYFYTFSYFEDKISDSYILYYFFISLFSKQCLAHQWYKTKKPEKYDYKS